MALSKEEAYRLAMGMAPKTNKPLSPEDARRVSQVMAPQMSLYDQLSALSAQAAPVNQNQSALGAIGDTIKGIVPQIASGAAGAANDVLIKAPAAVLDYFAGGNGEELTLPARAAKELEQMAAGIAPAPTNIVSETARGLGSMLGYMGSAALLAHLIPAGAVAGPLGGLAATAPKLAKMASGAGRIIGGGILEGIGEGGDVYYNKMENTGNDRNAAAAAGLANAAVQVPIDALTNLAAYGAGKAVAQKAIAKKLAALGANKVATEKAADILAKGAAGFAGEFPQETSQGLTNEYFSGDRPASEVFSAQNIWDKAKTEGLVGGLVGALTGAGVNTLNRRGITNANQSALNANAQKIAELSARPDAKEQEVSAILQALGEQKNRYDAIANSGFVDQMNEQYNATIPEQQKIDELLNKLMTSDNAKKEAAIQAEESAKNADIAAAQDRINAIKADKEWLANLPANEDYAGNKQLQSVARRYDKLLNRVEKEYGGVSTAANQESRKARLTTAGALNNEAIKLRQQIDEMLNPNPKELAATQTEPETPATPSIEQPTVNPPIPTTSNKEKATARNYDSEINGLASAVTGDVAKLLNAGINKKNNPGDYYKLDEAIKHYKDAYSCINKALRATSEKEKIECIDNAKRYIRIATTVSPQIGANIVSPRTQTNASATVVAGSDVNNNANNNVTDSKNQMVSLGATDSNGVPVNKPDSDVNNQQGDSLNTGSNKRVVDDPATEIPSSNSTEAALRNLFGAFYKADNNVNDSNTDTPAATDTRSTDATQAPTSPPAVTETPTSDHVTEALNQSDNVADEPNGTQPAPDDAALRKAEYLQLYKENVRANWRRIEAELKKAAEELGKENEKLNRFNNEPENIDKLRKEISSLEDGGKKEEKKKDLEKAEAAWKNSVEKQRNVVERAKEAFDRINKEAIDIKQKIADEKGMESEFDSKYTGPKQRLSPDAVKFTPLEEGYENKTDYENIKFQEKLRIEIDNLCKDINSTLADYNNLDDISLREIKGDVVKNEPGNEIKLTQIENEYDLSNAMIKVMESIEDNKNIDKSIQEYEKTLQEVKKKGSGTYHKFFLEQCERINSILSNDATKKAFSDYDTIKKHNVNNAKGNLIKRAELVPKQTVGQTLDGKTMVLREKKEWDIVVDGEEEFVQEIKKEHKAKEEANNTVHKGNALGIYGFLHKNSDTLFKAACRLEGKKNKHKKLSREDARLQMRLGLAAYRGGVEEAIRWCPKNTKPQKIEVNAEPFLRIGEWFNGKNIKYFENIAKDFPAVNVVFEDKATKNPNDNNGIGDRQSPLPEDVGEGSNYLEKQEQANRQHRKVAKEEVEQYGKKMEELWKSNLYLEERKGKPISEETFTDELRKALKTEMAAREGWLRDKKSKTDPKDKRKIDSITKEINEIKYIRKTLETGSVAEIAQAFDKAKYNHGYMSPDYSDVVNAYLEDVKQGKYAQVPENFNKKLLDGPVGLPSNLTQREINSAMEGKYPEGYSESDIPLVGAGKTAATKKRNKRSDKDKGSSLNTNAHYLSDDNVEEFVKDISELEKQIDSALDALGGKNRSDERDKLVNALTDIRRMGIKSKGKQDVKALQKKLGESKYSFAGWRIRDGKEGKIEIKDIVNNVINNSTKKKASVSDSQLDARINSLEFEASPESLRSVFGKNAEVKRDKKTGNWVVYPDRDKKHRVIISEQGNIQLNYDSLASAYGREVADRVRAGKATVYGGFSLNDGIPMIELLRGSATNFTANHELLHAVCDMALGAKQAKTLMREYGGGAVNENAAWEQIANQYAEWREGRIKPKGFIQTVFQKIADFLKNIKTLFTGEDAESIFRDIESGKIWEQGKAAESNVEGELAPQYQINGMSDTRDDVGDNGDLETSSKPSPQSIRIAAEERERVIEQYKGTDQWLKAPNGEDTKLTEEQWATVRTKPFKDWFGDWENDPDNASKVVDENGEPMVMYHGTKHGGFTVFTNADQTGAFFSPRKDVAADYTGSGNTMEEIDLNKDYGAREDGFVKNGKDALYPTFLNIRNLDDYNFEGATWDGGVNGLYTVEVDGNSYVDENGKMFFTDNEVDRIAREQGGEAVDANDNYESMDTMTDDVVQDSMDNGHYDGVVIRNVIDGGDTAGNVYVVFNPQNIKSATQNVGTFSNATPDIRYSVEDDSKFKTREIEKVNTKALESEKKLSQLLTSDGRKNFWNKLKTAVMVDVIDDKWHIRDIFGADVHKALEKGLMGIFGKVEHTLLFGDKECGTKGWGQIIGDIDIKDRPEFENAMTWTNLRDIASQRESLGDDIRALKDSVKEEQEKIRALQMDIEDHRNVLTASEVKERKDAAKGCRILVQKYQAEIKELEKRKSNKGTMVSASEYDKQLKEVFAKHPDWEGKIQDFVKITRRQLDRMTEAGIISQEVHDRVLKAHPNYIPLARELSKDPGLDVFASNFHHGLLEVGQPLKKYVGDNTHDILSPVAMIAYNEAKIERLIARQNVINKIVEKFGNGEYRDFMREIGDVGQLRADELDIMFYKDGVQHRYAMPKDIAAMLKNDFDGQVEDSMILKWLQKPGAVLRAGVTRAPSFFLRNAFSDSLFSSVANPEVKPLYDTVRGLISAIKKDNSFQDFMENGGYQGMTRGSLKQSNIRVEDLYKSPEQINGKAKIQKLLGMFDTMAELSETATRLGTYKRLVESGFSKDEAAYRTVDQLWFNRGGKFSKKVNKYVPFFNASLQGTYSLAKAFFRDGKFNTAAAIRAGMYITLPSMIMHMWNCGDDDRKEKYLEIPQWQKNYYWNMVVGDDVIKIPKPHTAGVVFGSFVERWMDKMLADDKRAYDGFTTSLLDSIGPDGIPILLKLPLELSTNYSMFYQRNIVPASELRYKGRDQYGPYTSDAARWLAEGIYKGSSPFMNALGEDGFNVSPRKIEYVVDSLTGSAGRGIRKAADAGIRSIEGKELPTAKGYDNVPVVGRFIQGADRLRRTEDTFRRELDDALAQANSAALTPRGERSSIETKYAGAQKSLQSIQTHELRAIAALQKEIKEISKNNRMSGDRKAQLIEARDKKIKRISKNGLRKLDRILGR